MKLRYTPRAQSDLDAIFSYLDAQDPDAAQAVKTAIARRIALLGTFPLLAPVSEMTGVHELTIIRYPYKAYYEIRDGEVWVLHIRESPFSATIAENRGRNRRTGNGLASNAPGYVWD